MAIKTYDYKGTAIYLGSSKGIVIDNKDPNQKGRIRVKSPVFGTTGFIPYLSPDDGFFSPPDIGTIVYLEPAGGDINYPIATKTLIDGPATDQDTPSIFRRVVPTNRGWVSPGVLAATGKPAVQNGGNSLELDDGKATVDAQGNVVPTAESRGIRATTATGYKLQLLEEGADGTQQNRINLVTAKGHTLQMVDEADKSSTQQRIQATTLAGQTIQLIDDADAAKQQITIKDADGRTLEIIKVDDRIRIRNQSNTIHIDIDLANDVIEIDANNVKLGTSAAQAIVRGTAFETFFAAHTHPAPGGPTGVPFQTMVVGVELSDKHKVE